MKYMKNAVIAIVLILSLIYITAGCGSTQGGEDDESFMEKYEGPEVLEHSAISFCFPGQQPKNWEAVRTEIESRSAGIVNASLNFKWIEFQQYIEVIKLNAASGEVYDAYCLGKPDSFYPDFTSLAREGKLKDISDLFPEYAPVLFSKYSPEDLEYASVDGRTYAVPSLSPMAYSTYLMVDDSLHKKYNLPDITTLEQYEAYLKKVKENEPDMIPGTIANSVDSMSLFARAFDYVILDEVQKLVYKWNDPEMKVVPWEQTPEYREATGKITEWLNKGYMQAQPDQTRVTSFVFHGQLSPQTEETQFMTYADSSGKITQSNPLRVFYLYPEKKIQRDNPMGTFYSNGSFVFPEASANTERVLRFLDWVQQSSENYSLIKYGIENKDYVLKEGYPVMPDGMDFNNRSYMYWDGNWAFDNAEFLPSAKDMYGSGLDTMSDFLNKYSQYPPHRALYPNYKTVQEIADQRANAVTQFEYKVARGLVTDFSEIEAFIKQMKDIGTDNLVEEVQKQMSSSYSSISPG